jgi:hypothetical protein
MFLMNLISPNNYTRIAQNYNIEKAPPKWVGARYPKMQDLRSVAPLNSGAPGGTRTPNLLIRSSKCNYTPSISRGIVSMGN